jgi:hypothetical protein
MWLAEHMVETALYPHLLWMATDPEGWDRAHRQPPPTYGPFQDRSYMRQFREASQRAEERQLQREHPALIAALEAAVPMWIEKLRGLTEEERVKIGHEVSQVVAEKGDILMFGSKRQGEVADVFNATAKGLAALAFSAGGVTFCGLHWEAHAHQG